MGRALLSLSYCSRYTNVIYSICFAYSQCIGSEAQVRHKVSEEVAIDFVFVGNFPQSVRCAPALNTGFSQVKY